MPRAFGGDLPAASSPSILAIRDIRRLGLLGGTFDPIHRGHIALARHAVERLSLEQVWFLPSARPPHKIERSLTAPEIRWEMTKSALAEYEPRLLAVNIDLRREGLSYTVQTLREVRSLVGREAQLFWIVGRDNVAEIPKWYHPRELVTLATIVAGGRPGAVLPKATPDWLSSRLVLLDGPNVDLSSTRIREQVASGVLDPAALPEPVIGIIRRERLYGYRGPEPAGR